MRLLLKQKNQLQRKNKVTNSKCTYCGEHHHYQHELVCDNVRTLYPLPTSDKSNDVMMSKDYFLEETKALRNDFMILNRSMAFVIEENRRLKTEIAYAKKSIELSNEKVYRLRKRFEELSKTKDGDEEGDQLHLST